MQTKKLQLVSIFLAVALIAGGCTAVNNPQAAATVLPVIPEAVVQAFITPAATAMAVATATTAAPATEAPMATAAPEQPVPQTGNGAGGLVIAIDAQNSEARYRVREQLAGRDLPNDAVGRTKAISGGVSINPDGTVDTAKSKIVVDLSTLKTDNSMRDNFVQRNVLQTSQFPNATFVPTQVTGLAWPLPQSGPVTFQLTGDLTIRDVTKPVTWNVSGEIQNSQTGQASGAATTSFTFAEFNLEQPRVRSVLSIDDKITLEVDVVIQP